MGGSGAGARLCEEASGQGRTWRRSGLKEPWKDILLLQFRSQPAYPQDPGYSSLKEQLLGIADRMNLSPNEQLPFSPFSLVRRAALHLPDSLAGGSALLLLIPLKQTKKGGGS